VKNVIKDCKLDFRADKKTIQKLFECNRLSGQIWNDTLTLAKVYHKNHGRWITRWLPYL